MTAQTDAEAERLLPEWETIQAPPPHDGPFYVPVAAKSCRPAVSAALAARDAEIARLREALTHLVDCRALKGVREQVAGWNGEGKPDGPYSRHPNGLGATLPKTNCGAVYALDAAMVKARAALQQQDK